jgi:hypothetical protein
MMIYITVKNFTKVNISDGTDGSFEENKYKNILFGSVQYRLKLCVIFVVDTDERKRK